tara:strand:+ start:1495 stop:2082 length:588 start_codon:yes stop_codon:yes gene_type:complete
MNNKLLTYSNSNNNNDYSPNIFIEKKETFEGTNNTINTLNEEIVKLKRKLSVLYDKEKEIDILKDEIKTIKKENNTEDMNKLIINRLESENKKYKNNNDELTSKIIMLENKSKSLEKKNIILLEKISKNILLNNKNTDNIKVKVDVNKLKELLNKKLEIKNDNLIHNLIKKHGITDNQEIDKKIISNIIKSINVI